RRERGVGLGRRARAGGLAGGARPRPAAGAARRPRRSGGRRSHERGARPRARLVSDPDLDLLLAVRGPDESRLATALSAPGTGAQVVRRCADVEELVAVTGAGLGAAAVVSADHPGLTRDAVAVLHDAGIRLLA